MQLLSIALYNRSRVLKSQRNHVSTQDSTGVPTLQKISDASEHTSNYNFIISDKKWCASRLKYESKVPAGTVPYRYLVYNTFSIMGGLGHNVF